MLELVCGQIPHGAFEVGSTITRGDGSATSFRFELQLNQTLQRRSTEFVSAFRTTPDLFSAGWTGSRAAEGGVAYEPGVEGFDGVFPVFSDRRREGLQLLRDELSSTFGRMLHLTSVRSQLDSVYENRSMDNYQNPTGAEAPFLLNENPALVESVAKWYEENLGTRGLSLDSEASSFGIVIGDRSGTKHNLSRAGQGVQQVLPVVTYLLALGTNVIDERLIVIEEPELHLHPSAHGSIADLVLFASTNAPTRQIVVETHSENLVLRLRKKVAYGELSCNDVNIVWFEFIDGDTRVKEIEIRPDGSVTDWPSGIFSEDLEEVRAIARAQQ
jgi:hypothetical protein